MLCGGEVARAGEEGESSYGGRGRRKSSSRHAGADRGNIFGGGPIPEFIFILKMYIYANFALITMK